MTVAGYRILEHPSDVGIEARGASLKEAFEQAATGLLSIITDISKIDAAEDRSIRLTAKDLDNLLVRWLSEILYLYDGEDFLVGEVVIKYVSPTMLEAIVSGEPFNEMKHTVHLDVKAVTYHQLSIQQQKDGCLVRVFLDI